MGVGGGPREEGRGPLRRFEAPFNKAERNVIDRTVGREGRRRES